MVSLSLLLRESIVDPLLALGFPPICPACGASLGDEAQGLCRDCDTLMVAARLAPDALDALRASIRREGVLDDLLVLSYFDRQSPLQALIHRLKYQGATSVARDLGARLGSVLAARLQASDFTGIVPVPLHPGRRRERGYNQAALIAGGISSVLPLPVLETVLLRARSTASQTGLTAAARHRNVAGAFTVRDGARQRVRGGAFLIVDDVLTTGATLEACAQALKCAGALRCTGAAVALTR